MDKAQLVTALETAFANKNAAELDKLAREAVENYETESFGYYYLAEAFLLASEPNLAKAETCIAKAWQESPNNAQYILKFADVKEQLGEYDNAQILYSKVLDIDPDNNDALAALALYELRQNINPTLAITYLDKIIAKNPNNLENYIYRAEAWLEDSNYEAAQKDLQHVLSLGFNEAALVQKINLDESLNNAAEIEKGYTELLKHKPEAFNYHYNFALFLYKQQRYTTANQHFAKAVELLPADIPFQTALYTFWGQSLLQTQEFAAAKTAFDKVIQEAPEELETYLQRAAALNGLQEFDAAIADLDVAKQKAGNDEFWKNTILSQRGEILIEQDKLDEASELFEKFAKDETYAYEAKYGQGLIAFKKGKMQKAYQLLRQALQAAHPKAKGFLAAHFTQYLKDIEKELLTQNAAQIAKNAQNPLFQKMVGKFWEFDSMKSKKLEQAPPALLEHINTFLSSNSLVVSEAGLVLCDDNKADKYTYLVEKGGTDAAQISLIPLDGLPPYSAKIKVEGSNLLLSLEEGEFLRFKEVAPAQIKNVNKKNWQAHLRRADADFLGTASNDILKAIF